MDDELDMDVEIVVISAAVLTWHHNPAQFTQLPLPFILEVDTLQVSSAGEIAENPNITLKEMQAIQTDPQFARFRAMIEAMEDELDIRTAMRGAA